MRTVKDTFGEVRRRYSRGSERPLGGYVASLTTFGAVATSLVAWTARRGGPPQEFSSRDIALLSVAVFRSSRLLTAASVTSPLRAPFMQYAGSAGAGEVAEEVQHSDGGKQHAVGELLSCPYCLGAWLATAFGFGLVLAPRWTRFTASILAVEAGSDVMQKLYSDLQAR